MRMRKKRLFELSESDDTFGSHRQGNILEDATAIDVLSKSKAVSNDISEKQLVADATTQKIDEARSKYVVH